jgi:opacity protein-like surface antigen
MFKTLLAISFAILLHSCSAAASFEKGDCYLTGIAGMSKLNKAQEKKQSINFTSKQDAILSPSIGVGVGYHLTQDIRAEIVIHAHSPYFAKSTDNLDYLNNSNGSQSRGSISVKRKATIQTLMLNNYYTILHEDDYDIFIGGGIGIARIKEKVNLVSSSSVIQNNRMFTFSPNSDSTSTKKVNNFTYSLAIGITVKLKDHINMELAYNWRDFGKTKPVSIDGEEAPTKNRYKGHDFTVGFRLAI